MRDSDDYVLREATVSPDGKPLQRAALCTKCQKIKPVAEFKRRLTRAQAMARGYQGVNTIEIESSMCKDCQPRKRSYQEMTTKELHNLAAAGDVRAKFAQDIIEKRTRELAHKRREELSRQWKNSRDSMWGEVLGDLRTELARVQQQEKNAKRMRPDMALDFFFEYKKLLANTREQMKFDNTVKNLAPNFVEWQAYVSEAETNRMRLLWEDMPFDYRRRVTQPSLVIWRRPENPRTFPAPDIKRGPSPAERLAHGGNFEH